MITSHHKQVLLSIQEADIWTSAEAEEKPKDRKL